MNVPGNVQIKADPLPLFSWTRPVSYWEVIGAHLPLTLLTGIPLLIAGVVPLGLLPLIPCTFLTVTGYPCPFCGVTRSFWAMAEGDWAYALYNSPLACLLYIVCALVFAWNATGLLLGVKIMRGFLFRLKSVRTRYIIVIITVCIVLNWTYRLGLGLK